MNVDDAVKMIFIMASADGECSICARALFEESVEAWPELDWEAVAAKIRERAGWLGQDTADLLERVLKEKKDAEAAKPPEIAAFGG